MTPDPADQRSRFIDRKRLLTEYGFTGATADKVMRACTTFQFPGERKTYVRRDDVERLISAHALPRTARETA